MLNYAAGNPVTGYNLTRSLRFRASATPWLNRTLSAGNQKTWTLSTWLKRGTLGSNQVLLSTGVLSSSDSTFANIGFNSSDQFTFTAYSVSWRTTTQVFRDPSAWYHIVLAFDTTQATAANRVKLYVNGVQVTSFSSSTDPALNTNYAINQAAAHYFGYPAYAYSYPDQYLAETNFIDGQQLTPSSFGSTNSTTGVWQPARYTGTYGTNGFYLPFTDNAALTTSSNVGLGKDFSGNGNYWTTNNISITAGVTYDSMTDVPTLTSATAANFATLNPLNPGRSTLTNGNLTASGTTDTPTIIPDSGMYYFEIDGVSKTWTPPAAFPAAAGNYNFGQRPFTNTPTGTLLNVYNLPDSTIKQGNKVMDATLYTGTLLSNSVVNAAAFKPDLVWLKSRSAATNNELTDSVRGVTKALVSNSTAAEATDVQGLTAFNTNGFTVGTNTDYNNLAATYVAWQWQAGAGSSGSNTNGTITSTVSVNATAGFSVVTYTGTGANATVGHGLGIAPSFVIVKSRGQTSNWMIWHSTFTGNDYIELNTTTSAQSFAGMWNSSVPTSSVINLGSFSFVNGSGIAQVAYCWSEIPGFSKFGSYVGNGNADGSFVYLGFKPKFVMTKRADASGTGWTILDSVRGAYNLNNLNLYPNDPAAEIASASIAIDMLSNGFKIRGTAADINASGGNYIYAAFAENPFRNSLAR